MAGADRYFGGRSGEAEKARKRAHKKHGVAKGELVYRADLAERRKRHLGRGRGTSLQRAARGR